MPAYLERELVMLSWLLACGHLYYLLHLAPAQLCSSCRYKIDLDGVAMLWIQNVHGRDDLIEQVVCFQIVDLLHCQGCYRCLSLCQFGTLAVQGLDRTQHAIHHLVS